MPTIIESLLFEIGIDAKKLRSDAKESSEILKQVEDVSQKAVKETEERGKKTEQSFKSMTDAAGSFFKAVATAYGATKLVGMGKDIVLNAESLGYLAKSLNMNVSDLEAWQIAAQRTGTSAEAMTGALQQAQKISADLAAGREIPGVLFGLNADQMKLRDKDPAVVLQEVIRVFNSVEDAGTRMQLATEAGFAPIINFLSLAPDQVRTLLEESKKLTAVDREFADTWTEINNLFRDSNQSLKQLGTYILKELTPALKGVAAITKESADGWRGMGFKKNLDMAWEGVKEEGPGWVNDAYKAWTGQTGQSQLEVLKGGLGGFYDWVTGKGETPKSPVMPPKSEPSPPVPPKAESPVMPPKTESSPVMPPKTESPVMPPKASSFVPGLSNEQQYITAIGQQYGVRPEILDSVWLQESSRGKNMGNDTTSARGHFQFTKGAWKDWGTGNLDDRYDFKKSLEAAAKYLAHNQKVTGSEKDAVAAFFGGLGGYKGKHKEGAERYAREVMSRVPAQVAAYNNQFSMRPAAPATPAANAAGGGDGQPTAYFAGPVTITTQSQDPKGIQQEIAFQTAALLSETGTM